MLEKVTPHGTWRETSEAIVLADRKLAGSHFTGTCQKCFKVVPAVQLRLTRLPFGRGEVWACKGGC